MHDLIHDALEGGARQAPDAPLLLHAGETHTYAQVDAAADRFRRFLVRHGVERGERVLLALENGRSFVSCYLGTLKAGAVAVPVAPGARSDRLPVAVDDCRPRLAVVDAATAKGADVLDALRLVPTLLVDGAAANDAGVSGARALSVALDEAHDVVPPRDVSPADLAAIIYTSGSTGAPKGVMLSHGNFVSNARAIVEYLSLTAADRVLCALPFSYVYGLSLLHTHLVAGGSLYLENRVAFPNVLLDGLQQGAVTGFAGVPSTFALLLHRSRLDEAVAPHLRYVTVAGGAMPPERIAEWRRRGPRAEFFVMYGATEAAARLTYLPPADLDRKAGSIGRPIAGVTIRIVSPEGADVPAGEVGELVASGPNIARGYWNDPEETARRFSPLGYHTGDLGYVDAEGYLFLTGRSREMIKVGANRVGPREIEDVLQRHEAVHETAVVGAPHDLLGESPVAFVALTTPLPDAENVLRAYCAQRLTHYKVPTRIIVLDELPKLPESGKVARAALARLARS